MPLYALHYAIQRLFGWQNSHLHKFNLQPVIGTPTDVLYYNYDFGDDWMIRITASMDACDLVEQGRVTQQDLDEAIADIYKITAPSVLRRMECSWWMMQAVFRDISVSCARSIRPQRKSTGGRTDRINVKRML